MRTRTNGFLWRAGLVLLCLCAQAWALNDFSEDPNCVALYNFEAADFTTPSDWIETDPGADISFPARYKVQWSSLNTRNTDSYVYHDYGAGYFSGDFTHKFILNVSGSSNAAGYC